MRPDVALRSRAWKTLRRGEPPRLRRHCQVRAAPNEPELTARYRPCPWVGPAAGTVSGCDMRSLAETLSLRCRQLAPGGGGRLVRISLGDYLCARSAPGLSAWNSALLRTMRSGEKCQVNGPRGGGSAVTVLHNPPAPARLFTTGRLLLVCCPRRAAASWLRARGRRPGRRPAPSARCVRSHWSLEGHRVLDAQDHHRRAASYRLAMPL